ncbi:MAG: type I pullulanase, partial [Ruminococcus sp.]|nr:type I pullulanase [Ruminococcus sp.]
MQADFNDIDNRFFYDGTLGAEYHKDKTVFRVWAPLAEEVTLNIYATGNDDEILSGYSMVCENGVWTSELAGDLDGKYYTYTVK